MTAEEVALEEFREAVRGARVARRDASHGSRIAFGMHASKLDAVRALARVIRAIRAEREERGYLVDAFGQGIRTAYETGRRAGRRDALRGVQWACLFEMGRLEEKPREYGGASWDWEGYPEDMHAYDALWEVVEAAEEAAR